VPIYKPKYDSQNKPVVAGGQTTSPPAAFGPIPP